MPAYCLKFSAPLHVDSQGTSFYEAADPFVRSDTLSAAVLSAWAQLDPQGAEERAAEPPFLLSSAFPFFRELRFLPRPVVSKALPLPEDRLDEAKSLKKVRWLDWDLWCRAVLGDLTWTEPANRRDLPGGLAVYAPKAQELPFAGEGFHVWREEERPRIAVERGGGHAADKMLFYFTRIHYQRDGGLYFLARFPDARAQGGFEAALSWLADSGLGADRSNGHGLFTWEPDRAFDLPAPTPEGSGLLLSLANPAPNDTVSGWLDGAAFEVVERGGWVSGSSLRRNPVRMFAEGSSFRRPLEGRVLEVGRHPAGHPVFRDGRGFFVGTGG
ncbi:MAG: type III-A CRISPR-associated RAMP protein Csm4 [Deltaproteobacteria bacterium]|nr:type III-A CRISPR-associated RAMP protein Csm4 [Deltaproteobacteria bacterium]